MFTRAEHLAWSKQRALEYLPDSPIGAFDSMVSDLRKHAELADHSAIELGMTLWIFGHLSTPGQMRKFIEGFN